MDVGVSSFYTLSAGYILVVQSLSMASVSSAEQTAQSRRLAKPTDPKFRERGGSSLGYRNLVGTILAILSMCRLRRVRSRRYRFRCRAISTFLVLVYVLCFLFSRG